MRRRLGTSLAAVVALVGASLASMVLVAGPAAAGDANDEATFRTAFANDAVVNLTADITLATACDGSNQAAIHTGPNPVTIEGNGFTITQTCDEDFVLNQQGDGLLTLRNVTIQGASGGIEAESDVTLEGSTVRGKFFNGAAAGVRGEGVVTLDDSVVTGFSGSDSTFGVYSTKSGVVLNRSQVTDISDDDGDAQGVSASDYATLVDASVSGIDGSDDAYGVVADGPVSLTRSHVTGVTGFNFTAAVYATDDVASLTDSYVRDITSTNGFAYAVFAGDGTVRLLRSTLADADGAEGAGAVGAYAFRVELTNSTITRIGGLAIDSSAVQLAYSDIVGNGKLGVNYGSVEGAGAWTSATGWEFQIITRTLTTFGSVITDANDGLPNCDVGTTPSQGYNFADDTTCGLTATGDRQAAGLDPLLGPLADNGGPTPTLLPQAASPLLEAIPAAACQTGAAAGVTTDQRSEPRPGFTNCDIGSVELQPAPVIEPNFTG